jgi:LmbE family N-acetylglucosaminyl deacetylase
MKTILGIWAHPDDEVFVSGGLMAEAARRGDRVVCLHATRGESGLYFRRPCDPRALGKVRELELEASLGRLGVAEHRFLGYADGRLSAAPRTEAITQIQEALVELSPDVVVTFGPDGYTGHPDHKAVSSWVTAAVRLWNRPRARVLQAAVPAEWKESLVPRLNEFDFFWPGHPASFVRGDVSLRLDDELVQAKVEAIRAHASQMSCLFDAYGDEFIRWVAATEVFRLGPRPAFRSRILADLKYD